MDYPQEMEPPFSPKINKTTGLSKIDQDWRNPRTPPGEEGKMRAREGERTLDGAHLLLDFGLHLAQGGGLLLHLLETLLHLVQLLQQRELGELGLALGFPEEERREEDNLGGVFVGAGHVDVGVGGVHLALHLALVGDLSAVDFVLLFLHSASHHPS